MPFTKTQTRSTRAKRPDGLAITSPNIATPPPPQESINRQQSNIKRKRPDTSDLDQHRLNPKRTRLVIEIKAPNTKQPAVIEPSALSDVLPAHEPTPPSVAPPKCVAHPRSPPAKPPTPINHSDKTARSLQHELERLQPSKVNIRGGKKDEKRKLRSQEGTRFKSELSLYFPEYDELIGNSPKEEHVLNPNTPIIVVDTAKLSKNPSAAEEYPLKAFPSSLFDDLYDAERADFSTVVPGIKGGEDPLSQEYLDSIHRRPERQEKTLRNNDKDKAQHEKGQVIRLRDGLYGADWLKIMGVSGITDSRKKEFEAARLYFQKGCDAIIEKFRVWKEEEKRRKHEKELAKVEAASESEDEVEEDEDGAVSDGDPPDADASATRQLLEESSVAINSPKRKGLRHKGREYEAYLSVVQDRLTDFQSFFPKPHLREAALGKHRRSGRSAVAWGHPVPDVEQADFDLPEEYRDAETLKAHARRKRRDRRVGKS